MGNQNVLRSSQERGLATGHVPLMAGIHMDACGACHLGKTRHHLVGGILFQREKLRPGWGAKLDWVSCNIDWALLVGQSIFLDYTPYASYRPCKWDGEKTLEPPAAGSFLAVWEETDNGPPTHQCFKGLASGLKKVTRDDKGRCLTSVCREGCLEDVAFTFGME